jgi:hypothetical protein
MKSMCVILFLLVFVSCNRKEIKDLGKSNYELNQKITQLELINDSLREANMFLDSFNYWYNNDFEGINFEGIGQIKSSFIENSLQERVELIPAKAVLGGTMYFTKTQVIGNKWIVAGFEDGHILGMALYKYEIKDSKIEFKLIDSYIY